MSENQTLSVIFPVGPVHRWLGEAVESVLSQALPPGYSLEVILSVDGIPESLEAARKLSDPRVGIVYLHENRGAYIAQNTALSHCRGDILSVHGADDISLPGRLWNVLRALEAGADTANTIASATNDTRMVVSPTILVPAGIWTFRRKVLERLGGWMPWRCSADTEFHLRTCASGFAYKVVDSSLYLLRQHPEQLTRRADTAEGSAVRASYSEILKADYARYVAGEVPARIEPVTCAHTVEGPLFKSR